MNLNEYQLEAQQTDRAVARGVKQVSSDLIVPLLGLAGETGELLSEYKKSLRDGDAHRLFKDRVAEELGDVLWYVANVAAKFDLTLDDVAKGNLTKTRDRWGAADTRHIVLDADYPEAERFPRRFGVELDEVDVKGVQKIRMRIDGIATGDPLTDNSDDADGYRFHDVFHLAYVAVLGWSPVIRKLMGRKRRSKCEVNEVQDGGRAIVVDEAISALAFSYAKDQAWLKGVPDLDYKFLRSIKDLTSFLEVRQRSMAEWQEAILKGFEVWNQVVSNNGGLLRVDLDARDIAFVGPPQG